jgi:hypothetical protein
MKVGKLIKLAVISSLLISLIFTSCGVNSYVDYELPEEEENTSMFVCCEVNESWRVYYHRESKVMYVRAGSSGFTLMVNPDGTPMTYDK